MSGILLNGNKKLKKKSYLNLEKEDNHNFNIVQECFNKRFSFEIERNKWKLPTRNTDNHDLCHESPITENERWQIKELEKLKSNLNHVKSKLNSYNFGDWHKHTRSRNPGGLIMRDLRNYEIELLTQAWCKFFELLSVYKVVPHDLKSTFRSFHLCEAPGAFICSLNHYLKLNYPSLQWEWFGNTLNPYYEGNSLDEMINDDRFISKTLKYWWFGEDYTGNLRHKCNFNGLINFSTTLGSIHLVTADGSIDCCKNPGEQENFVLPLHYSEAIAALSILSPGGNFIMKIFTIYECETVCLLYLLCCVFKSVSIHKPVVSKEGNSEVYVICHDYLGKQTCESILNADYYGDFPRVLFRKEDLPESFIEQIIKCSTFFTFTQISVLERNIGTYHSELNRKKRTELWKIRTQVAKQYIQLFNIYPLIDSSEYVLKGLYLSNPLQLDAKNEEGTFEDRVEAPQPDNRSLLVTLQKKLELMQDSWPWPVVYWIKDWNNERTKTMEYLTVRGKPIKSVRSSKFCKGSLLKVINELSIYGICNILLKVDNSSLKKLTEEMPTSSKYATCSVGNANWLTDFHSAQKECVRHLISALESIELNGSFILTGLPLLMQFNVGLVYLIGSSFSQVGIVTPEVGYAVIFRSLQNFECLVKLKELADHLTSLESAVLSIVPISCFLEGEFYKTITTCNHLIIKRSSLTTLKNILQDTY